MFFLFCFLLFLPLFFYFRYFNFAVFLLVLLILKKKSADISIFVSLSIMYSLPYWLLGCFFITDFEQLDYDVQVIFILFRQSFLYFLGFGFCGFIVFIKLENSGVTISSIFIYSSLLSFGHYCICFRILEAV